MLFALGPCGVALERELVKLELRLAGEDATALPARAVLRQVARGEGRRASLYVEAAARVGGVIVGDEGPVVEEKVRVHRVDCAAAVGVRERDLTARKAGARRVDPHGAAQPAAGRVHLDVA